MKDTTFNTSTYTIRFNAPAIETSDIQYVPGSIEDNRGVISAQSRSDVLSRKAWFAPDTTYLADWTDNADDEVDDTSEAEPDSGSFWLNLYRSIPGAATFLSPAAAAASNVAFVGATADAVSRGTGATESSSTYPPASANAYSAARALLTQRIELSKADAPPKKVNADTMFPNSTKFGFRFMYNPSLLGFRVGMSTGVNIGYIMSGGAKAMPTGLTSTNSNIAVSFPISRIEDLHLMEGKALASGRMAQMDIKNMIQRYNSAAYPKVPNRVWDHMNTQVDESDLLAIYQRGTMYDLDFLFRTCLGRQWSTFYRGYTADVGLAFSVPLVLYLGPSMIYRVRLADIGYTHKMFTPDMTPMYTEVTLNFERIPDVVGYSPPPVDSSGDTSRSVSIPRINGGFFQQ